MAGWFDESFAEHSVDLHLVMHTDDTVMIWYTARGRHVGSGFPRLKGLPIKGNEVTWPQVHFRVETVWSWSTGRCGTTRRCWIR